MACRLVGAKSLSKPMLEYCWLDPSVGNKLQWNLYRNLHIFIQENVFENVICKMVPICLGLNVLSVQYVKVAKSSSLEINK